MPSAIAPEGRLRGKHILLGVSGSVAAYKSVQLARLLVREGARVTPVLTARALHFVGETTFSAITGQGVVTSMWGAPGELHVSLTADADALVIVPATADLLARMATGRGDDLLAAVYLCARQPVLCAPAMHPAMWSQPAVARNVAMLKQDGVQFVGPVSGEVASGDVGVGRMAEPEEVLDALLARLASSRALAGRRVVITAGPTFEDIDPVRFVGNRSSGTLGFAIAAAFGAAGADVTLVAGPVSLATPPGVRRVDVRSAAEMHAAVAASAPGCDVFVAAAAVADFRPAGYSAAKLKKTAGTPAYEFVQNADILADVCAWAALRPTLVVGFALETGSDEEVARLGAEKRARKGCDWLVANRADQGLGAGDTRLCFVDDAGAEWLGPFAKRVAAEHVVAACRKRVGS